MSTRERKKDVVVWTSLNVTAKSSNPEDEVQYWRLYLFVLAEELFPDRFKELKRRVLPIYERYVSSRPHHHSDVMPRLPSITSRKISQAILRVPIEVELEDRIQRWVDKLCLANHDDFWVRELALRRVQAWHEGLVGMPNPVLWGSKALVIQGLKPREDERIFRQRVREGVDNYLKNEVPRWKATRKFRHHFEWFLQHRVGGKKLTELAYVWDKRNGSKEWEEPTHASVIQRGIRSVANVVDPHS